MRKQWTNAILCGNKTGIKCLQILIILKHKIMHTFNSTLLRPCYIWFPWRCLYSNEFQDATNLMWNFSYLHQQDHQWRQCGRWYFCRMLPRNLVPPRPSMSVLLCPWPCLPASARLIYSLFVRSLYCNNMHGEAIMDKFYKIRCVSFMLLYWSPIVEIFINTPLQSIDLIIQALTTTSLHHGRKTTRCVYLHPTDLLRDHNMSLTKTTIRTSRLHSKTRRKTQNFIVNPLLQMKKLLLSA